MEVLKTIDNAIILIVLGFIAVCVLLWMFSHSNDGKR